MRIPSLLLCLSEAVKEEALMGSYSAGKNKDRAAALPAWLQLPTIYYLDLPGSQTAAFRLQPQLPDEFSLIAFEVCLFAKGNTSWLAKRILHPYNMDCMGWYTAGLLVTPTLLPLSLQAAHDAEQLKAWFSAEQQQNGSRPEFSILSTSPAEFLALAEGNGKAVAFIGANELQASSWIPAFTEFLGPFIEG